MKHLLICIFLYITLSSPSTRVGYFCVVRIFLKYLHCVQIIQESKLNAWGYHFRWHLSSHLGL